MTIYSYVSATVMLHIGDQTYRIDGPNKMEIKLPRGEYPFTAYIAYSDDGTPVIEEVMYHGRYQHSTVRYFLATTGKLWVDGMAELNIRNRRSVFHGTSRMEQEVLTFETQNCELTDRRDGFLFADTPKSIIRSCKFKVAMMYIFSLLVMAAGITFTVLLAGVLDEAGPMSEGEFYEVLPMLIAPVAAVIFIAQTKQDINFIKQCQKIPVLMEEPRHDDL